MDREFQLAYRQLNTKQKLAVDTIDGPVLVLAGPGTGKTQLLSSRAANIVHLGAASAANILCLTYTDVGASELRQRLGRIMGPAGSDVTVHTFHSFGTWLIRQYPEQFSTIRSLRPLDVLGRYHILEVLLEALPFRHAFARRGDHDELARLRDVADGIQAFKRAGYEPSELRAILDQNQKEYAALEPLLAEIFVTKLSAKRLDAIAATVNQALQAAPAHSYSAILLDGLSAAVAASQQLGKTAALGDWRTKYTTLQDGQRILKSSARQQEVRDLVDVYEKYQERLLAEGRFDYEDMVLQAAEVLEQQADLRLDVAERFQYLMVDEYQDTNGAQNRLLDAILTANPLDSPNVLVVGDDDQAIMRFQGAEVSGMVHFIETYEPVVIPLEDNYRSGQPILDAASQIIGQTAERLETALLELGLNKTLTAHTTRPTEIAHWSYRSPSAEYAAVAQHVAQLIKQGVAPSEIAVISRKHPELKDFVPFMIGQGIAISYDRRENILDDGYIRQLLELARFVQVLSQQPQQAQSLLPTVLAADYWNMGPYAVYDIAIAAKQAKQSWLNTMRGSDNQQWRDIAEWLVAASANARRLNRPRPAQKNGAAHVAFCQLFNE
jgi:DNA helicase-2/ATP-dependent DNA helicase PcrA